MTQATTFSVPTTGPASPDVFALRTDDNFTAALTGHSGSTRPTYAEAGTIWQDTSVAGTVKFYLYDGTDDNLLYTVDTSTGVVTWAGLPPSNSQTFGQCRLSLSGGNLLLSRLGGKLLTINGAHESIPSAGVTLAASGLTPSTLYYIYAYMNSGTMTLEASTTAYATDSTTGVVIKSGDATRTLVGMARPVTGPAWVDSNAQRFVRSWFNDRGVALFNTYTANRSTSGTTPAEIASEIRCEFLIWAEELVDAHVNGTVLNTTASGRNNTHISIDGGTVEPSGTITTVPASENIPVSASALKAGLAEGYHYATVFASVDSGTGTWYGDSNGRRTSLKVRVF